MALMVCFSSQVAEAEVARSSTRTLQIGKKRMLPFSRRPLIAGVKDGKTESSEMIKVSGIAVLMTSKVSQIVHIEHCALMGPGNQWVMEVQCRTLNGARDIDGNVLWESLLGRLPDAKVEFEVKHNSVTVTLPPIHEYLEVAVFGTPGENDMIRKQIAVFGPKPEKGLNWTINTILYDDTVQAFEQVRQKERGRGNKLLTARAGLFVANIADNINIELSVLQPGWRIKGSNIKVIKSIDAWKMPKDGAAFPRCSCEIVHVDESKESFICGITVSHGEETTKAEVVAIFKQTVRKRQEEAATTRSGHQKQTVGAHTSNKERKKEIGRRKRESLIISVEYKRVYLLVAISFFVSALLCGSPWNGYSEAVTRNGKPCALAIMPVHRNLVKVIKSIDAWKMPKDGAAFPRCSCEIVHVDESKEYFKLTGFHYAFVCGITVSHGEETTKAEVVKIFKQIARAYIRKKEQEKKIQEESRITSDKHTRAVSRNGKSYETAIIPARHWSLWKVTKSKDAWKVLAYCSSVGRCRRKNIHADESKESFICRITVSHGEETIKAEVATNFKQTVGAHISDKKRKKKIQGESLITSDELKRAVTRNGKHNATAIILVRHWSLLKIQIKREQNVTGQDCRAKRDFCTKGEIGSNIIRRPNDWYKLNEGIGGVRANYKGRFLNQSYVRGDREILLDQQQTM